jgi:hypothetical protein
MEEQASVAKVRFAGSEISTKKSSHWRSGLFFHPAVDFERNRDPRPNTPSGRTQYLQSLIYLLAW